MIAPVHMLAHNKEHLAGCSLLPQHVLTVTFPIVSQVKAYFFDALTPGMDLAVEII
jgi:hypothetical protein